MKSGRKVNKLNKKTVPFAEAVLEFKRKRGDLPEDLPSGRNEYEKALHTRPWT